VLCRRCDREPTGAATGGAAGEAAGAAAGEAAVSRPGEDLGIVAGPGAPDGLSIPASELLERFSRSSGPGGQSVNTTDSRVELEYDVARSNALTDAQRRRAVRHLGERLVAGRLVIVASEHRSQHRNRVAARERLADLLRSALAPPPPPRRATKPSLGSKRRRLHAKKLRGRVKELRGPIRDD
jgi:ribosome-associated protein